MLHSIPATGIIILNQIHILHASLIESTKTVAWVPLFNALLETVEWWWLSQIFMDWGPNFASYSWYPFYTKLLVLLCMHSRTWLLSLWEALSHNLKILVIIAANTNFNFPRMKNCHWFFSLAQLKKSWAFIILYNA